MSGRTLGERINDLPPEVLSEILYWCIPTAKDQESSKPRFALVLSHVCRHWRNIALETPRLWTYTKIRVIQHHLPPALELMKLYLERSKTCPIFIDIDFVDIWMYYAPVLKLFEQVVEFTRKYRPVNLLLDSFLATHLEAGSDKDMARREEWYFWSARAKVEELELAPGSDLSDGQGNNAAVTLRALRVANGSFVLDPYLSWASSLTYLVIKDLNNYTNLTLPGALQVLDVFPLLVHCTLHIDYDDTSPLPATRVEMKHLKSFSLSWVEWVDMGRFVDALAMPALEELELSGYVPDTANGGPWRHLANFVARNRPPLKHLILDEIDCFHVSMLDALALTPQLEGLWLENCILDDTIVRGLHADGTVGVTASLATLVLIRCYAFDVDVLAEVLVDVRTRRQAEHRQGLTAYVDDCGMLTREKLERLRAMDVVELGKYIPLDFIESENASQSTSATDPTMAEE